MWFELSFSSHQVQQYSLHTMLVVQSMNPQDVVVGKGRTTTGMILACLLKDILFGDNSKTYYQNDKVTEEEFPDEDEYLEEVQGVPVVKGQNKMAIAVKQCISDPNCV